LSDGTGSLTEIHIGPPGFEFHRVSGHSPRRGAGNEIARVRQHPSHPTRRGPTRDPHKATLLAD